MIGVCGGTASGKTTVTETIKEYFKDTNSISVVNVDFFYKGVTPEVTAMFPDGRVNFDDPRMIDDQKLLHCLKDLKAGKDVELHEYSYAIHNHTENTFIIKSADIVIVEGIFAFHWPEITQMFRLRVFVHCNGEYRLIRRIRRDMASRGRTLESVLEQYETFVKPSHDKYVEPCRHYAHLIIPWETRDDAVYVNAVETLISHIQHILSVKKANQSGGHHPSRPDRIDRSNREERARSEDTRHVSTIGSVSANLGLPVDLR